MILIFFRDFDIMSAVVSNLDDYSYKDTHKYGYTCMMGVYYLEKTGNLCTQFHKELAFYESIEEIEEALSLYYCEQIFIPRIKKEII
jgi:hypothetical protein